MAGQSSLKLRIQSPTSTNDSTAAESHSESRPDLRLDKLLLAELRKSFPQLSRAWVKKLFAQERVRIGDVKALPSTIVSRFPVEIEILNWSPSDAAPERARPSTRGCFLEVVHEDAEILVLNKTSGTPSVPHSSMETETAVGAALAHLLPTAPDFAQVGRGGLEPGILHRLDTGTSGLLVFAKTNAVFEHLHKAWRSGGVRKEYRALVREGTPARGLNRLDLKKLLVQPRDPITIDLPLAHDPKSSKRMVVVTDINRKLASEALPAHTRILAARQIRDGFYDLHLEITTGVMHQIRCHLSSYGWPILGDPIYHGTPSRRLWLHASSLTFPSGLTVRSGPPF